ncbi:TRAP transporter small permease [Virgibacillus halodenitrificans]|jgi:TRAP-type transport system small permease protein|uniref:TRAP transporter small permease protein n=1 Tax=Virgibacillus halodenitrificans TaxID=1482 RepID=A0AAC9J2J9_VIRHA|nr:TRAP transporter small permease [Virgibacillus halodenitrificans]APC49398.1 TRAP transporter small permease protein [Virgibacillus halodenitrificans]MCG1030225.1 TRAP transporter small permease [Virgibacillus halodenitrificans]MCJ0929967.1 TRAP transporter small permease [Virgibacillus halodenitrificans]MEC2158245.1 TRAP transporter small permease [Virgibacillus halodenitrificans]MYL47706.1 TRAP transporter small permease subunit [Virgibacillus halodenitrificans]
MKKFFANLEEIIGGSLFIIMLMILTLQIFSRQLFDIPLTWSEALAKFIFVYVGYLSISFGIKESNHVLIDYFVNKFPPVIRNAIYYIFQLAIFVAIAVIGYLGYIMALRKVPVEIVSLHISYMYMYAALPIISILMLYRLIEVNVKHIKKKGEVE